jgi:hypothetical protein
VGLNFGAFEYASIVLPKIGSFGTSTNSTLGFVDADAASFSALLWCGQAVVTLLWDRNVDKRGAFLLIKPAFDLEMKDTLLACDAMHLLVVAAIISANEFFRIQNDSFLFLWHCRQEYE